MDEKDGYLPIPKGFATDAIHHAQEPSQWNGMSVVTPIFTTTTCATDDPENFKESLYNRAGNPTRDVLEKVLAKLENAKFGVTYASGIGASASLLGLIKSGDHLIAGTDLYGGTTRLFDKIAAKTYGMEVSFVDFHDLTNLEKSIKTNTKLVWIETPTNPMVQIIDIKAVSEITKKHGLILVVDNTFLTPYFQRPLELGADIVMYSLTKYMNGHTDVLMGALVTSNQEFYEKLKYIQKTIGSVPSPFDCYQVLRGLKTLALRMRQHNKNAIRCAKYLEAHPKVEKVLHPGLPSHPQHELFKKQTGGHSGVFSFYLKGDLETSKKFLSSVKIFALAGSLGGCDSLIELASLMSHKPITPEHRAQLGITDTLVRLSCGIEDPEYLIADLEQALSKL